ncbi:unnamed protein product [Caenorhabditis angaria]|uniref:EF-hand domain-containing protein n=1 Tax=Caenorhabditis angaria TaxID=860376 RepID=A0A9P1I457_9PELO|nr:unnamed protein product [Caenorhabditis angaria]
MLKIVFLALLVAAEKERLDDGAISPKNSGKIPRITENSGNENVKEFFDGLDTNKDGFLDFDEILEWIVQSYATVDKREAHERMSEMDVNGDGFVSWEEYSSDSFSDEELANNKDDQILLEQDRKYFKAADVNQDGKLDIKELAAFNNPENYPHMHDVILEATLVEKDSNGDGAIDLNEYLGEIAVQKYNEWHEIEKERFMAEYDKNGDGKLTGDEIRHWLLPDSTIIGSAEAKHILTAADDNKDSKLSYEEVLQNKDVFAKSDASHDNDLSHLYPHEEL